ncbi:MAG: hypothetical protein ABSC60_12160, partial [Acidobacteriota bacterium]
LANVIFLIWQKFYLIVDRSWVEIKNLPTRFGGDPIKIQVINRIQLPNPGLKNLATWMDPSG